MDSILAFDIWALWATISWWTVKISLLFGIMTLMPGLLWILYDFALWMWRSITNAGVKVGAGAGIGGEEQPPDLAIPVEERGKYGELMGVSGREGMVVENGARRRKD